MIKTLTKTKNGGEFPDLDKESYIKPTANNIFNDENLKFSQ